MWRTILLVVALAAGCASTPSAPTRPAPSEADARAFFEGVVKLGNARDPRLVEAYADDAQIRAVAWAPDNSLTRLHMGGKQLKALYAQLLPKADPTEQATYDCAYKKADVASSPKKNLFFVECLRHSMPKDFYAPAHFVVGPDDGGVFRIFADTTWTCTEPKACTRDLPWAQMSCAETKHWRDPQGTLNLADCEAK
jgi:hypothetical protein